jgi:hypothetical protein
MTDLRRREEEMKQTEQQFQIPASRWKPSRLYQASKHVAASSRVITVDPHQDFVSQNYSF